MMRINLASLAQGAWGLAALGLVACGGSKDNRDVTTTTTIAGTLVVSGGNMALMAADEVPVIPSSLTNYKVRCVTLTGTPQAGEGAADQDGKFELSLLVENSAPIGCFVMEGSNVVAAVVFEEATETIGGGSTKRSGNFVAKEGATGISFGSIVVDLATGTATVDKKKIVETGGSATASTAWVDPTGNWKYEMFCDRNLYNTEAEYQQCLEALKEEGHGSGNVYVKQYQATDSAGGTRYGIALWASEDALNACGGEGAKLPAGWTVAPGSEKLTQAYTLAPFPQPSAITNPQMAPCDAALPLDSCDAISSPGTWSGAEVAGCKAVCVAQNLWRWSESVRHSPTACHGEIETNWDSSVFEAVIGSTTATVGANFIAADASGNNKLAKYGDRILNRFALGEATIQGRAATFMNYNEQSMHVCIMNSTGCSAQAQCRVIRKEVITMTQVSASQMMVKVDNEERLASGASATCLAEGSHLRNRLTASGVKNETMFIKLSK